MHNICLSPGTSSIIPQEIHETTSQQHLPSSLPAALEIVVAAIHLEKRGRHCCMLREPTVVSQNYVGRLKFIVVFMGTLLLMHKEMDKCWNTHPGKINHLGQNHGGMMGDSFLAIQIHYYILGILGTEIREAGRLLSITPLDSMAEEYQMDIQVKLRSLSVSFA